MNRQETIKIGRQIVSDRSIEKLKNKDNKIVWHIAMPKSGSTWVTKVIGKGLTDRGWKVTQLVPDYGYREQEVDPRLLLLNDCLDSNIFAEQQHATYSEYTLNFIQNFHVSVILQIRNVADCLFSLVDHLDNESVMVPFVFLLPHHWKNLSMPEKLRLVVDLVAPWYVKFWAGWHSILDNPDFNIQLVSYEKLIENKVSQFSDIAKFCDSSISDQEIKNSIANVGSNETRKNKGIIGRGNQLPGELKKQLYRYASYYDDIDFSLIGL